MAETKTRVSPTPVFYSLSSFNHLPIIYTQCWGQRRLSHLAPSPPTEAPRRRPRPTEARDWPTDPRTACSCGGRQRFTSGVPGLARCRRGLRVNGEETAPHRLIQACSRGSTHSVHTHSAAGISTDTQNQQQLTMRAMNRPKSCTAGI